MNNRKFCVLFSTKNHYSMFEDYLYKYSKANWNDVLVLNVDIDSDEEEIKNGKEVCKKLGIHYVNKDNEVYESNQNSVEAADKYLIENKIDVDWILFFQHDVVPMQKDFWRRLDTLLEKYDLSSKNVSMFGANSHQNYRSCETNNLSTTVRESLTGRGNLEKNILKPPHSGWYKNLPESYYQEEYLVVESPNWQCVGFNRKLFREHITIDTIFRQDLWPDDIAHQFMLKGFINIAFTNLIVCHDHSLKKDVKIKVDNNFLRNKKSHDRFIEKYGWDWGKRNLLLRDQFKSATQSWWDDKKTLYENSTQIKLFNMDINNGPKKIEDFE
jgi:hypothetical protein